MSVASQVGDLATRVGAECKALALRVAALEAVLAPVNTALPEITGTAVAGETLTRVAGSWTNATTVTGQWLVDGVEQSGETGATFEAVEGDVTYRETATNAITSVSATSEALEVSAEPPVVIGAVRFIGDDAGLRLPVVLGDVGARNYEVQALVYIEGTLTSEDRVFMTQFAAGRQAGLFVSNLTPTVGLVTGDSQEGSSGGAINPSATAPGTGKWALLTFSADNLFTTNGLAKWQGSMESLDGTVAYSEGGRHKGVEDSLTVERFDLNGGGVENGFVNGIRYAEVRGYNAQRDAAQRQADLTNLDPTGAEFWLRFSDNGVGGVDVEDITGNGYDASVIIVDGTFEDGPVI